MDLVRSAWVFSFLFSERKSDFAADHLCRRVFYATEAAFRSVRLLCNLLSLCQTTARLNQPCRRPAPLRTEALLYGAIAGPNRRPPCSTQPRLGGLEQRIRLIPNASRFCRAITVFGFKRPVAGFRQPPRIRRQKNAPPKGHVF